MNTWVGLKRVQGHSAETRAQHVSSKSVVRIGMRFSNLMASNRQTPRRRPEPEYKHYASEGGIFYVLGLDNVNTYDVELKQESPDSPLSLKLFEWKYVAGDLACC